MSVTIKVDTMPFNKSMDELQRLTGIAQSKIIRNTTRGVTMNLVRFTFLMRRIRNKKFRWMEQNIAKAAKGRARLGWWPAWKALRMSGAPKIGNGPLKDRGEGGIVDASKRLISPHITVFNEVPYINATEKKNNTLMLAMARQDFFLQRAIDREYGKILKRKF